MQHRIRVYEQPRKIEECNAPYMLGLPLIHHARPAFGHAVRMSQTRDKTGRECNAAMV